MPTRFLKEPVPIHAALRKGADLAIGPRWYSIDKVAFTQRLDAVEWWSYSTVARDYLKLTLKNPEGVLDVLVYVDRQTGRRFLQAVMD
jgi:hypothetical protein